MARPQPQHKPARPQREHKIPLEVWEKHRTLITGLYYEGIEYEEIRELVRGEKLFTASPKQYKKQYKRWGLRRNMNKHDAALILFLLKEAEDNGISRKVFLCNKEKTRTHISSYVKKTGLASSEEELLRYYKPGESRPGHISVVDDAVTQAQTHDAPVEMTQVDTGAPDSEESEPSDEGNDSLPLGDGNNTYVAVSNNGPQESPTMDEIPSIPPAGPSTFQSAYPEVGPIPMNQFDLPLYSQDAYYEEFPTFDDNPQHAQGGYHYFQIFNENMSCTPPSLPQELPQLITGLHPSWEALADLMLSPDRAIIKDSQTTLAQRFRRKCCEVCFYGGQDPEDSRLGGLLSQCGEAFIAMLHSEEWQQSLTVLNSMLALLYSYGQLTLSTRICQSLCYFAQQEYPGDHPVVVYTGFLMSLEERLPHNDVPKFNVPALDEAYQQAVKMVGKSSPLSLTCAYNLAYALESKDNKEDYERAAEILEHIRPHCEKVFGLSHVQTISCLSLLAQVYLFTDFADSAENLMGEVMRRVQRTFAETHPYFWEMNNRNAMFLIHIANHGTDSMKQRQYWEIAETILRPTLIWRSMNLGDSNPRTANTYIRLRQLIKKHPERLQEAEELPMWLEVAKSQGPEQLNTSQPFQ